MYANMSGTTDQGLRSYMTSIYNLMLLGLLASAGSAWFAQASGFTDTLKQGGVIFWLVLLSPLAIVFIMSFQLEKMKLASLHLLYWAFVVLEGLGLSVVLAQYSGSNITIAFLATAVGFAGCSLYGYTTRRNLSPIGSFLIFALFGLIGLMILNIFIPSPLFTLAISFAGVLIFAALTAWDTQSLKEQYYSGMNQDSQGRLVVMGALNLYLDFLNMFLFILRILGISSNDD